MNSKTLKEKNVLRLATVIVLNIIVVLLIHHWIAIDQIYSLVESSKLQTLISAALPATVLGIAISLLSGMLSDLAKARLIFWKWRNPLPGCEAFTKYALEDPRIDVGHLKTIVNPWPETPTDQNKTWYRLYKQVADDPAVIYQHREYLFMRDWASFAFIAIAPTALGLYYWTPQLKPILISVAALAVEYLVVRAVANNYGVKFVTAVLTQKSQS